MSTTYSLSKKYPLYRYNYTCNYLQHVCIQNTQHSFPTVLIVSWIFWAPYWNINFSWRFSITISACV